MDTIIILDFGSQYTQLRARKVRKLNIYCELHPFNKIPALTDDVKGVVFSGSPYSCNAADAPIPDSDLGQNKGAGQDYSKLLLSQIKPDYETDKWYRGSDVDGYECWYYKEIVAPNESADPLFRTFKLEWDDAEPVANQNYIGGIEVFAEAL